jgi:hypothetical protein
MWVDAMVATQPDTAGNHGCGRIAGPIVERLAEFSRGLILHGLTHPIDGMQRALLRIIADCLAGEVTKYH